MQKELVIVMINPHHTIDVQLDPELLNWPFTVHLSPLLLEHEKSLMPFS